MSLKQTRATYNKGIAKRRADRSNSTFGMLIGENVARPFLSTEIVAYPFGALFKYLSIFCLALALSSWFNPLKLNTKSFLSGSINKSGLLGTKL